MDSGFGSDFGGTGGGKLDPGAIMEQVKVQIAVANAQELLQRMTDKCFRKCIGKPGGSLDNSEQVRHPGNPRVVRDAESGASRRLRDVRVLGL